VTSGKPIAARSYSISGASAINPLVAFYDIHRRKREVQFFYFVPDTTKGNLSYNKISKCLIIKYVYVFLEKLIGCTMLKTNINILRPKLNCSTLHIIKIYRRPIWRSRL
jgi:hypothetical protein